MEEEEEEVDLSSCWFCRHVHVGCPCCQRYDTSTMCTIRLAHHLKGITNDVSMMIGPWNHSGTQHCRTYPYSRTFYSDFNFGCELAAFFLRAFGKSAAATGVAGGRRAKVSEESQALISRLTPVMYYVMQEEVWRGCDQFPLGSRGATLYLDNDREECVGTAMPSHGLSLEQPRKGCKALLQVNGKKDLGSIGVSRYHAMTQFLDRVSNRPQGWLPAPTPTPPTRRGQSLTHPPPSP